MALNLIVTDCELVSGNKYTINYRQWFLVEV